MNDRKRGGHSKENQERGEKDVGKSRREKEKEKLRVWQQARRRRKEIPPFSPPSTQPPGHHPHRLARTRRPGRSRCVAAERERLAWHPVGHRGQLRKREGNGESTRDRESVSEKKRAADLCKHRREGEEEEEEEEGNKKRNRNRNSSSSSSS